MPEILRVEKVGISEGQDLAHHGQSCFRFFISLVEFEAFGEAVDSIAPLLQFLIDGTPEVPAGRELAGVSLIQ